jgi:long-chain acyl-CoA synthetase
MTANIITSSQVATLAGLFRERVRLTPDQPAYRQYDIAGQRWVQTSWKQMATEVARWQAGFLREKLQVGDRVALMLRNSREWVVCDQAALGLGLVTVPLYVEDRPDNVAYILDHADAKVLLVQNNAQWRQLLATGARLDQLQRIISIERIEVDDAPNDPRLESLDDWLFGLQGELQARETQAESLASIVYTSGTTGRSKGVMLSHKNILSNVLAASVCYPWSDDELFLSFLPLSHMLERTAGYYLAMLIGAEVAYARSIPQLAEDLLAVKPTVLISVPRIYERVYGKIQEGLKDKSPLARTLFKSAVDVGWHKFEFEQGRALWHPKLLSWPLLESLVAAKVLEKLGGRLRLAICGGAPLSEDVAKLFIGLGLPLLQGYGLTESSPVISVNLPQDNIPHSIGLPLPGIQVRIGDNDELQSYSDASMLGYWKNEQSTRDSFTADGWLKTGDKARIDERGHIYITGRLKDIIVLANGEKVPPSDMEMAIALHALFDQVMIIGEGKPYLCAIAVLNPDAWSKLAVSRSLRPDAPDVLQNRDVEKIILEIISNCLRDFPGYAQIRRVTLTLEPWTVENGLITPTMKTKRARVVEKYTAQIDKMYEGHK